MPDLLIRNARPMGGETADILIRDGRIAAIDAGLDAGDATIEDARGAIAVPALVEAHTHLDKSLLGHPWYRNEVGPRLIDKIDNERAVRKAKNLDPYTQAMRQAIRTMAYGAGHIRSHVDVDTDQGLASIEGVMRAQEELRGVIDIEIVAFPQSGMLTRPGTVELLDEALSMGSEVVGGLDPCGMDRDPKGHLDAIFALAEKHGKPIDIHLHELGELGAFSLEMLMDRTEALGMQGQVAVSHAFCLGMPDHMRVEGLIARLADLDIAIVTTAPASVAVPPVKRLREAGVRVAAGNDGIRDTWGPYGTGDMLERAKFVGLRNNFRRDDEVALAFETCAQGGAELMRIEGYGLAQGCAGDVALLDAETMAEAVAQVAPRRLVVKGGRVVARDGAALVEAP